MFLSNFSCSFQLNHVRPQQQQQQLPPIALPPPAADAPPAVIGLPPANADAPDVVNDLVGSFFFCINDLNRI